MACCSRCHGRCLALSLFDATHGVETTTPVFRYAFQPAQDEKQLDKNQETFDDAFCWILNLLSYDVYPESIHATNIMSHAVLVQKTQQTRVFNSVYPKNRVNEQWHTEHEICTFFICCCSLILERCFIFPPLYVLLCLYSRKTRNDVEEIPPLLLAGFTVGHTANYLDQS